MGKKSRRTKGRGKTATAPAGAKKASSDVGASSGGSGRSSKSVDALVEAATAISNVLLEGAGDKFTGPYPRNDKTSAEDAAWGDFDSELELDRDYRPDLDRLDAEIRDLRARVTDKGPTVVSGKDAERLGVTGLPDDCCLVDNEKIGLQVSLGEKVEEREILAEKARVSAAVSEWKASPEADTYFGDPDGHDRECPLCLQPWPLYEENGTRYVGRRRLCCGKRTCGRCEDEEVKTGTRDAARGGLAVVPQLIERGSHCNYCRAKIPLYDKEQDEKEWRRQAEEGKTWAQYEMGRRCGILGDHKGAVRWYLKAAERGNRLAQNMLGVMYEGGIGVDQDYEKARRWLEKGAAGGIRDIQCVLGQVLLDHSKRLAGNRKKNEAEAVRWLTLSAARGCDEAQFRLGEAFTDGTGGLKPSRERKLYWLRKAAKQGNVGAQLETSLLVKDFRKSWSDDGYPIHLHDTCDLTSEAYYWARKARDGGADGADEIMTVLESMFSESCKSCEIPAADCDRPLMFCSRCKAVAYCSVECQRKNWADGHKNTCFRGPE